MLDKIQQSIRKFSERYAFNIKGKNYTYSQFAQQVSNIRALLEEKCSKSEKLIGVIVNDANDIETYASFYGCLFAGFGYVPINPKNPIDRNSSILEQTSIKTILCSNIDNAVFKIAKSNQVSIINTSALPTVPINLQPPQIDENEIAYLLFTSGSTGTPKGVPITRGNLNAFVDAFFNLGYNVTENDRFMQMFELTFDFSVVCYTVPLCAGACVCTVPSEGIKFANVYTTLEEQQITFACMVPSVLSYLKPYFEEIKLEKLKYSLFCGEMLLDEIAEAWSICTPNAEIINAYGPTEATVFCLVHTWQKEKSKRKIFNDGVCIGKAMVNTEAIIVNENLIQLPEFAKGELCLAGKQLTPGYWKDSQKNSQSFFSASINGIEKMFYKTGDLAFIDTDGDFMYAGRIDNQVKIQGFRIELGEIEHFAREFVPGCYVAAVGYMNSMGTMQIHLFVENYNGSTSSLENYLRKKVPNYMVPSVISSIPSFPLNANGKIDRKELRNIGQNLALQKA